MIFFHWPFQSRSISIFKTLPWSHLNHFQPILFIWLLVLPIPFKQNLVLSNHLHHCQFDSLWIKTQIQTIFASPRLWMSHFQREGGIKTHQTQLMIDFSNFFSVHYIMTDWLPSKTVTFLSQSHCSIYVSYYLTPCCTLSTGLTLHSVLTL